MQKGKDFLRAQVSNSIMQHRALLESLSDHVKQAEDKRFRELCERHSSSMLAHQKELEEYAASIGVEAQGGVKEMLGAALGKAKNAVDAVRQSDFIRIVEDIVMIRQAQDTFATFAAVGEKIGEARLNDIGRRLERAHDSMQKEFNLLCQDVFVAHVQDRDTTSAEVRGETRV